MRDKSSRFAYYLGKGTVCNADLTSGDGIMHIDGTFYGNIKADVVIGGHDSMIESVVDADTVILAGRFEGTINARRKVSILSCAEVMGAIRAPLCDVEYGAKIYARFDIKK